jgi:hypothetical protein
VSRAARERRTAADLVRTDGTIVQYKKWFDGSGGQLNGTWELRFDANTMKVFDGHVMRPMNADELSTFIKETQQNLGLQYGGLQGVEPYRRAVRVEVVAVH